MAHTSFLRCLIVLLASLGTLDLGAQEAKPLVCGIAVGYPPYQFTTPQGQPTGIDAEIARLVFKELGRDFRFDQRPWDDLYLQLSHLQGELDLLCGAEINAERLPLFEFSQPYYSRVSVIFVRESSPYHNLRDLDRKTITGDRASYIEQLIKDKRIRVLATASKEASFGKLQAGTVDAVIAPLEVGTWISREMGLKVRILPQGDPGSPVGFAVAKGNTKLAGEISAALAKLARSGSIGAVLKKYR